MTIEFIRAANFTVRPGRVITAIVLHYTASLSIEGTIAWFQRAESGVSAHYVIGRDGRVVQMVKDADVAWHAGKSKLEGRNNVNSFSLGIELVGTADSGFEEPQLAALDALVMDLVKRYKIRPEHVVGHAHVAPTRKIDPDGYTKQFNWTRMRLVAAEAFDEVNV